MNYKKHHDAIIDRARSRTLTGYYERHHIIPRCMGGSDDPDNIVALTPEEHYVVHQLLVKMHPGHKGLVFAAIQMSGGSKTHGGNRVGNKLYGWLKRRQSFVAKQRTGKNNGSYGRSWYHDPETLKNGKFLKEEVPEGWAKGRKPPKPNTKCCECGKDTGSRLSKWCDECRPKAKGRSKSQNKPKLKACFECGLEFEFESPGKKFCSEDCKKKSYNWRYSERYVILHMYESGVDMNIILEKYNWKRPQNLRHFLHKNFPTRKKFKPNERLGYK